MGMCVAGTMRSLLVVGLATLVRSAAGEWPGCTQCLDSMIDFSPGFGQDACCSGVVKWLRATRRRHDGVGLLHHRLAQLPGLRPDADAVGGGAASRLEALSVSG